MNNDILQALIILFLIAANLIAVWYYRKHVVAKSR